MFYRRLAGVHRAFRIEGQRLLPDDHDDHLKHELSGCWSRRIVPEHRLVYQVKEDKIHILACRYHY
jgi:mRNA-degrading endonuclease YafQ of YafQ-DinJ toxin-antitoxin module